MKNKRRKSKLKLIETNRGRPPKKDWKTSYLMLKGIPVATNLYDDANPGMSSLNFYPLEKKYEKWECSCPAKPGENILEICGKCST